MNKNEGQVVFGRFAVGLGGLGAGWGFGGGVGRFGGVGWGGG